MAKVVGTTPTGISTEQDAAFWVRGMFGRIAPRYDLLNTVLSGGLDRYWRARTVQRVSHVLTRPEARVLDLCCGSGALLTALERRRRAKVWGSDFCHPLLVQAQQATHCQSPLIEADALRLPLPDGTLDLITIAFGFRNFANYGAGLLELRRVLKPGGTLAILEFSTPPNPAFRSLYHWYSRRVLPAIGGLISGERDAYTYLPESVRKFPNADELADDLRRSGFPSVTFERMTGGIVALHVATAA